MVPYLIFWEKKDACLFKRPCGADYEARTRYLHLGKVALYQMSYIRTLLVPPAGIEPATRGFSVHCSTNWAIWAYPQISVCGLWRPGTGSNRRPLAWQASVLTNWTTGPFGGNNRARTCDPLLVRQMLSQLSYAPTFFCCCVSAAHIR